MPQATTPVAPALLLTVALGGFRVSLPVLLLVAGMRVAPLPPAAPHGFGVERIGTNLVAMVFTPASTLAGNLAANGLLKTIRGKLENLLAVTAVAITHQAAPDQNRIRSFCPQAPQLQRTAPPKNSPPIETPIEFLYRLPANGTAVNQTGRTDVPFHRNRHPRVMPRQS
jgi:hypothetical protein